MGELVGRKSWLVPDVLILHAGGNDLGKVNTLNLMWAIKKDIASLKCIFPDAVICFPEIVPRLLWSSSDFTLVEKKSKD